MNSLKTMKEICQYMSTLDTISDISELKKFRKEIDNKQIYFTRDCNFSNSHIYGIWENIFGKSNLRPVLTPSIEHGLIFHNQVFNDIKDTSRMACATFGYFRKNIIQQNIKIPVFCVGPYIHYAQPIYSTEKTEKLKKKYGKTLTVFPIHSTNKSVLSIDEKSYVNLLRQRAKSYDTVLINVFWWDINNPLIDKLASEGYKIVSAGFRDDVMFLSRLKTIIQLSDLVIGDSVGTHIGYCVDCGVPFCLENIGSRISSNLNKENKDKEFANFHQSQISNTFLGSSKITKEQLEIVDLYWGTSCIKTEEELLKICNITSDLMYLTRGFQSKLYSKVLILLKEYKKTDIIKHQLLLAALPQKGEFNVY